MPGPPKGWRSGKDTQAFFAEMGINVHLATITRQKTKYPDLFQKHGRTLFIDAERLLEKYKTDFRAAMHAGELGGARASRMDAQPVTPRVVSVATPAPVADDPEDAANVIALDPIKRKATAQAKKAERENAVEEGLLIPAANAHAAIAFAIAEAKQLHKTAIGPAAERIAAMFKDDARAAQVRALLDDTYSAGWNAFAGAAQRELTKSNPLALARFAALEAYAYQLWFGPDDADQAAEA